MASVRLAPPRMRAALAASSAIRVLLLRVAQSRAGARSPVALGEGQSQAAAQPRVVGPQLAAVWLAAARPRAGLPTARVAASTTSARAVMHRPRAGAAAEYAPDALQASRVRAAPVWPQHVGQRTAPAAASITLASPATRRLPVAGMALRVPAARRTTRAAPALARVARATATARQAQTSASPTSACRASVAPTRFERCPRRSQPRTSTPRRRATGT
jgi:hypothetical protein